MGKRNQERRRAKKKQRDAQQRRGTPRERPYGAGAAFGFGTCECGDPLCPGGGGSVPPQRGPRTVSDLLDEAMVRLCAVPARETARREAALERAAALFTKAGMSRAVLQSSGEVLHGLWHRGWQPADVVRAARRELKARHARIAADLIAAEHRAYPVAGLFGRWAGQLADVSAEVWWGEDDAYLQGAAAREKCEARVLGRAVVELLELLSGLPEVPQLMPAPCEAGGAAVASGGGAEVPLLAKIRALLAKAESTRFPEEAEALTAKAQQLMAQHSIDAALLAAERGDRQVPGGVRVAVDSPYEEPKAILLQAVAEANRCRTVWSRHLGFSTVVGFASDVEAVELLYTSLLVQAQSALQAAGARTYGDGASRTRSFRQSFLVAYATRIDQRLGRVTEQATEAASDGGRGAALLPVLASRAEAVDDRVDELFGELSYQHSSVHARDREGWAHGTAAADRAELHGQADALR
ncbi:DUF2786 domain-containing protein [Streptomyces brasiliensis]|uniref:DUF2786 domain-containing protein n=1 Tax=Streptomyces brasiliensis TaxID=1954 RepID=UPI001670BFBA|nr:DUF2786 domain-containing protein [Streptomyces brasiliensis]